jgi:transcriptional regulator with XRE-family HTH domain
VPKETVEQRVARAVTAWIEASGLNPTEIHKQTGLSRETIYRINRGESLPSTDALIRIAEAVKATPGQLLDGVLPNGTMPQEAYQGRPGAPSAAVDRAALAQELEDLEEIGRTAYQALGLYQRLSERVAALESVLQPQGKRASG